MRATPNGCRNEAGLPNLHAWQIVRCCNRRANHPNRRCKITYHLDKPLEEMLNFPVKGDIDLERLKPPPLFDNNDGMG
jgi:hypothetical protein